MFSSAWNEPSGCLWYDEWPTKLHNENVRSLETCDMQLSSSIYYILVTSVYESKQPVWWSPVHQLDHLTVCGMMGGPLCFLLRILYHWKAVICSIPTVYCICYICNVSISVKAALLLTCGASDGLCGLLQYDQCSTELSIENNISLESCDMQHSSSKYYIFVTSLY